MWTIDYEDDIASDLSAFHRIDDPLTIPGPRYFSLAVRLPAYAGVMAARVEELREQDKNGVSPAYAAAPTPSTPAAASRVTRVPDDAALAMLADGWVEHTTEGTD